MIKIGIIIHGPFCKTTERLLENIKIIFNEKNVVYVYNNYPLVNSSFNNIKVLSAEDPGELEWLGRKGRNLLRHMENVRMGAEYLKNYDYIFKVRSDLKLSKNDLIRMRKMALYNQYKLIKIKNFGFYLPFYDHDYMYGAPAKVLKKSSELVLFNIEDLFQAFLYNRNRVFPSANFVFPVETLIDLSLWITISNISLEDLKKINPLYNYEFLDNMDNIIYFKLNQIRAFPRRLSPFSKWYLKSFFVNYLYPKFMKKIDKLIFKIQIN